MPMTREAGSLASSARCLKRVGDPCPQCGRAPEDSVEVVSAPWRGPEPGGVSTLDASPTWTRFPFYGARIAFLEQSARQGESGHCVPVLPFRTRFQNAVEPIWMKDVIQL